LANLPSLIITTSGSNGSRGSDNGSGGSTEPIIIPKAAGSGAKAISEGGSGGLGSVGGTEATARVSETAGISEATTAEVSAGDGILVNRLLAANFGVAHWWIVSYVVCAFWDGVAYSAGSWSTGRGSLGVVVSMTFVDGEVELTVTRLGALLGDVTLLIAVAASWNAGFGAWWD
jgi:hypothetical protein